MGRSPIIAMGFGALDTPSRMRMPKPPQKRTTFICHSSFGRVLARGSYGTGRARDELDEFERRNREDQLTSPRTHVFKLLADLLPEVPREDEDVVGLCLREALRREDRDVGPRQELALLHRAAVHGVGDQVGPDAAVIQQRVALAG